MLISSQKSILKKPINKRRRLTKKDEDENVSSFDFTSAFRDLFSVDLHRLQSKNYESIKNIFHNRFFEEDKQRDRIFDKRKKSIQSKSVESNLLFQSFERTISDKISNQNKSLKLKASRDVRELSSINSFDIEVISVRDIAKIKNDDKAINYNEIVRTTKALLKQIDTTIKNLMKVLSQMRRNFLNAQSLNYIYEKNERFKKDRTSNYQCIDVSEDRLLSNLISKYPQLIMLNSLQSFKIALSNMTDLKPFKELKRWIAAKNEDIRSHMLALAKSKS